MWFRRYLALTQPTAHIHTIFFEKTPPFGHHRARRAFSPMVKALSPGVPELFVGVVHGAEFDDNASKDPGFGVFHREWTRK